MKRLCGFDINGWRDFAIRNWHLRPREGVRFDGYDLIEGGIDTASVKVGSAVDGSESWIGGAQAKFAPHGRGDGWGAIGALERRMSIRSALEDCETTDIALDAITATNVALGRKCDVGVHSVDDTAATSEIFQERLLRAMSASKVRHRLLVWRSVLAVLNAIQCNLVGEDDKVAVFNHCSFGFTLQVLRIRRESGTGQPVLAPERRSHGVPLCSKLGYSDLFASAKQVCRSLLTKTEFSAASEFKATGRLALGIQTSREIVRRDNVNWTVVNPPPYLTDFPVIDIEPPEVDSALECDVLLLETLAEGPVRAHVKEQLSKLVEQEVTTLKVTAVADAALEAARRLERRDPVYFDFLPRISTITDSIDGPQNYDLIDRNETLPAGKTYRSPNPAKLQIQPGQRKIEMYLRKEEAELPRLAEVCLSSPVENPTPIELSVEQAPASGRAKLFLRSKVFSGAKIVNWENADEHNRCWDDIIESLKTPPPTIPDRLVLPCGLEGWSGKGDLTIALHDCVHADRVDWKRLAMCMHRRVDGNFCVSSDGELPPDVPEASARNLEILTGRAVKHVGDRIEGRITDDNESLKFLTWQFRRCPEQIGFELLKALKPTGKGASLFHHSSHAVLAYQGLGRVVKSRDLQLEALSMLLDVPTKKWKWRQHTACASFILTRSDEAIKLLNRNDVEKLADVVIHEFRSNFRTEYTRFLYAPLLLVGLLRWRIVEPTALVAGTGKDRVADHMLKAVSHVLSDIELKAQRLPKLKRFARILKQTQEELKGRGSNPTLLREIFDLK